MSQLDREKWDRKYADPDLAPREPSPSLLRLKAFLPKSGRALDVAGGAGRNSIWLAQRGLDVTLADVSEVGLELAQKRAVESGATIRFLPTDLESDGIPAGPWDLVLSHYYFCRSIFSDMVDSLTNGGRLVVVQPTVRNLERNDKPPREFLLEDGELLRLAKGLETLFHDESWTPEGRYEAVIVARKVGEPNVD